MKFLTNFFRHFFSRHIVVVCASVLLISITGASFPRVAFADDPTASNTQRLVTIHDNGQDITVLTRALTIRGAVEQANVVLGNKDIVEPSLNEKLAAKSYQVNIFRARPIVVIDGSKQVRVMTAEQSPRQIAKVAGIVLHDEDTTVFERVNDVLAGGGAGVRMTIGRATSFNFTLYGKEFISRTQAKTVGELLKEKGINLGAADGVSPSKETSITSGIGVRVWRNGKQTVTQEEVIARPVEQVMNADMAVGVREVQDAGADGTRNATYEIETKDGVEVSRVKIASVTTLEAIKQVVVVGTKVSLPAGSHTDWMAAAGIAASDYGYVDFIVGHESGWSPTKSNYGGSGAYGLCQSLPASKMSSAGGDYMTNPITQLKWCNGYAVGRYGSWAGAYSFWTSHKWW